MQLRINCMNSSVVLATTCKQNAHLLGFCCINDMLFTSPRECGLCIQPYTNNYAGSLAAPQIKSVLYLAAVAKSPQFQYQ